MAESQSDSKVRWNSGTVAKCHSSSKASEVGNSGTVIVKCAGTVEHAVAESIVKNVGTVAQCHSDSNSATVCPEVD